MPSLSIRLERLATPLGQMLVLTDEQGHLRALDWQDYEDRMYKLLQRHYPKTSVLVQEVSNVSPMAQAVLSYFDGDLAIIDQLPVATGGTDFQRAVWQALRHIPQGQTISYGELAKRIGRPKAMRAVGLANGANPIGIVLPCHRVIGSNASLTGYAGGLNRKQWLLNHEQRWQNKTSG